MRRKQAISSRFIIDTASALLVAAWACGPPWQRGTGCRRRIFQKLSEDFAALAGISALRSICERLKANWLPKSG